ncbi:MAG: 6,7-dimethyl-8-ribityllumazine synthase [Hyphomicrobiales bacterium]|nr:MAG: 6,7-dimethyl-8-ribityllumazine synthase [Hyphomicrobiales bacterium]
MTSSMPKLLIVDARFYTDLADELFAGAVEAIEVAGFGYDRISVPGVLELPAAVKMAFAGAENGTSYAGYVVLGCVIRGETSHYDIVCNESARALMDLSVQHCLALGNGIQTVENMDQAWARANRSDKNKGRGAAEAALAMIKMRQKFGL